MHYFLEGVGPFELEKLVLSQLVTKEKRFSLEFLNRRITSFPYGLTDVKSRPSEIPNLDCSDHKLKQKAFQFWALFRLLPLIMGDMIPPNHAYWEFYLELREIADILFCQKWTFGMAAYFREIYASHMRNFKELFPDFQLIPKHHYLVHYPTFAMHTGPPYKMMVAAQRTQREFLQAVGTCCVQFQEFALYSGLAASVLFIFVQPIG